MTVYKGGRRIFSPEEQAAAGAEVLGGMVAKQVDKQSQLQKTPTIPVYDSTNWPDEAVRGQIVRDINDLDSLWIYGEDDIWHKISSGTVNTFPRFFTINMDQSVTWPTGPYTGLADREIDWKNHWGGVASPVWVTNDTEDGSHVQRNVTQPIFDEGEIFSYDWSANPKVITIHKAGAYLIYGYVDLRVASSIDGSTINNDHVLGITGPGIIQSPQKQFREDHNAYSLMLRLDMTTMAILINPGSSGIILSYGHKFPGGSTVKFQAELRIVWLGPFVAGLTLGYGL
jgi:hypothetical protein